MKKRNHLNSNVTRIKQYMAERNTTLTAEDISDSLGITKSYTYMILDLMQALDVVDKVKRGVTYYYLKGEHGEEQLNLMLNQRKPPVTPKIQRTPRIQRMPRIRERPTPIIQEREKTLMEENLSTVDARVGSYGGLRSLALLGLAEAHEPQPSPAPPEEQTITGPPKLVKVRPFGTIKHLPKGFLLLATSQARHLRENYLRGLAGYEDLADLPRFFAKDSKIRRGYYGNTLYASRGTNPWDRIYRVTLDPSINQGLPGLEEQIWSNWRGFNEPPETHRGYYGVEEYDPIIDKFIESGERLVEIIVEDRQTSYVKTILEKRIRERGIEGEVAASHVGEWLYLERTNLRAVK